MGHKEFPGVGTEAGESEDLGETVQLYPIH